MLFRTCTVLLVLLSACATTKMSPKSQAPGNLRLANLQRAAALPWTDDGHCVVREAANKWPVLAERCFHALDHKRVRFNDVTRRCAVAQVGAAAVGGAALCILAAPEIVTGAVIVMGVVVVAAAIDEALAAYRRWGPVEPEAGPNVARPAPQPQPTQEPLASPRPKPEGSPLGRDWLPPPEPVERERRPECKAVPVPHRGGDDPHNNCADSFPPNRYPGNDVLVNGKRFDALQVGVPVLWEIKTDQFDTYNDFLRDQVIKAQVPEMKEDRKIAVECGYDFVVGVSTAAHKKALLGLEPFLDIVVTRCPR